MSTNPRIKRIEHLPDYPDAPTGLLLMHRLAHLVYPLMQKFNLKLWKLAEFYPVQEEKGKVLLGLNTDRKIIEIRLRSESDPRVFLPREIVVNTLIHE